MSTTTRISLLLTVLVLLTTAAVTMLIFVELDATASSAHLAELRHDADSERQELRQAIEEGMRDALFLSRTPPIRAMLAAAGTEHPLGEAWHALPDWQGRLQILFEQTMAGNRLYVQLRLLDVRDDGKELLRLDRTDDGEIRTSPTTELQHKGQRDYVQTAVALPDGTDVFVSRINLNREHGRIAEPQQPTLRIVQLLRGVQGTPLGLVAINVDMRTLFAAIRANRRDDHHGYLLDDLGHYLVHPDPAQCFGADYGRNPTGFTDFPALRRADRHGTAATAFEPSGSYAAEAYTYGREPHAQRLHIVVQGPAGALDPITQRVLGKATGVGLLLVAAALACGLMLARRLTTPLTSLARAVEATDPDQDSIELPAALTGEAATLGHEIERAYTRLRVRQQELLRSNRDLDQFAYVASHDLQEPLRTVLNLVTMLREDHGANLAPNATAKLDAIEVSAQRLRNLVRDLLTYSRIGRDLTLSRTSLSAILAEVQDDLHHEFEACGAELACAPLPDVVGNHSLLRLLFQNLISNALKFRHPDRAPQIAVTASAIDRERCRITVSDNGIGIPPQHRERVFGLFQRLHSRTRYDGTGIGLAHCKRILEHHGSEITVTASASGGAAFSFELRHSHASSPEATTL